MQGKKSPVENKLDIDGEALISARRQVHLYLLERVPVFRRLSELREQVGLFCLSSAVFRNLPTILTTTPQGWNSPAGGKYFQIQREKADHATEKQARMFFKMMQRIARELDNTTGFFRIRNPDGEPPSILDWCMAPGGFVSAVMEHNRRSKCRAFSLPRENGGHKVLLSPKAQVAVNYLDINLLAADMGVDDIPLAHPEAQSFLPRQVDSGDLFDLVICDGQVLRTHERPEHRERLESARLVLVQLALGLEHARPGGKMLILLHKIETWDCLQLLYVFNKFSSIQVFKPKTAHKKRSTCYLVASNIQSQNEEAIKAVRTWKEAWKVATFGTLEEYKQLIQPTQTEVEEVLDNFGLRLIELATNVWETQAEALAAAPFMKQ